MEANRLRVDSTASGFQPRPTSATSTLSRVFSLDPDEDAPPTRISPRPPSSLGFATAFKLQHPAHREDPPMKYHAMMSFSFLIKVAQLLLTVVCVGLYTRGMLTIQSNISTQMFPNVVCSSYLIIISVIMLSYVLGQKMPELLIRIFNTLGCILFFISFALTVTQWAIFGEEWENSSNDETDPHKAKEIELNVKMYVAQGGFSLLNSILFLADVVFSIRRTLSYL